MFARQGAHPQPPSPHTGFATLLMGVGGLGQRVKQEDEGQRERAQAEAACGSGCAVAARVSRRARALTGSWARERLIVDWPGSANFMLHYICN